jgi:hypothetical protein
MSDPARGDGMHFRGDVLKAFTDIRLTLTASVTG